MTRIGGTIAISSSLEKFHIPKDGFLAIDATQFQTWNPALGFDLPTVSVSLPVPKDIVMTSKEIIGNAEQEDLSVLIRHGAASWGPVQTDATGNFTYTDVNDVFNVGLQYDIKVTDIVGNTSVLNYTMV